MPSPTAPSRTHRRNKAVDTAARAAKNASHPPLSLWTRLNVRLSAKERVLFVKYIAVLLDAGIPLPQAIDVLRDQATGATKTILDTVSASITGGHGLADGLAHYPHVFSQIFLNLIRAGERTGTLSENLQYLATQSQKQYDLKQSIRGAMMYPSLVLVGGITVTIFIIVFIFPNILSLFKTMQVDLPITTRTLLHVADFFETHPIAILVTALTIAAGITISYTVRTTRKLWDSVLLHVPIIGSVLKNAVLSNFFRLLGTLLQSGMPLADALRISNSTITNHPYNKLLTTIEERINQGGNFADELVRESFLIPPLAQRLIHVGNETGMLEKMLLFLAEFYAKEVDESSKRIATLVEPVLIITMGALIGFIALSVISPIYQVINKI